jgi:hypothetical protein
MGTFFDRGSSMSRDQRRILSARRALSLLLCACASAAFAGTNVPAQTAAPADPSQAQTLAELRTAYRALIDAENVHDLAAVRSMLLDSPSLLFISRVEPVGKGDWGGYWGIDSVMQHFGDLYKGYFRLDPDYSREKEVLLTPDVAETYAPMTLTSSYGGQAKAGRPFIMVVEWVRTPAGWKVATDIPMPIPPAPVVAH